METQSIPMQSLPTNQVFEILSQTLLPEYASKEKIKQYALNQIKNSMNMQKVSSKELAGKCQLSPEEVSSILNGNSPLTKSKFINLTSSLGEALDKMLPFNPKLPVEKYTELYKKLYGNNKPEIDPTGFITLRMLLVSYAF